MHAQNEIMQFSYKNKRFTFISKIKSLILVFGVSNKKNSSEHIPDKIDL
jgi:hypothetical protein